MNQQYSPLSKDAIVTLARMCSFFAKRSSPFPHFPSSVGGKIRLANEYLGITPRKLNRETFDMDEKINSRKNVESKNPDAKIEKKRRNPSDYY